jgi:hypothetical protein
MSLTLKQRELLKDVLKIGRRIQHRFDPEPVFARTGVGSMRGEGVMVLQKIKQGVTRTEAKRTLALHQ